MIKVDWGVGLNYGLARASRLFDKKYSSPLERAEKFCESPEHSYTDPSGTHGGSLSSVAFDRRSQCRRAWRVRGSDDEAGRKSVLGVTNFARAVRRVSG